MLVHSSMTCDSTPPFMGNPKLWLSNQDAVSTLTNLHELRLPEVHCNDQLYFALQKLASLRVLEVTELVLSVSAALTRPSLPLILSSFHGIVQVTGDNESDDALLRATHALCGKSRRKSISVRFP
eukprot:scaffold5108_cov29-Prasinocladus_malaysianus.AAC.2